MKKLLLVISLFIGVTLFTQAQTMEKSIGVRITNGGEFSFQNPLGNSTRAELDFGIYGTNTVLLTGIYQWVFELQEGFNWYAGVGAGVGSWSVDENYGDESGSFVFAAGDIGIEYNFQEAPIQLSLDFRPELYFGGDYADSRDGFGPDIALGIRYRW